MKRYLVIIACLLLAAFATPVFADLLLKDEGNNIGYMYDEDNPDARYYIKDLDKFFTYIMHAAAIRNDYDHQVRVTTQIYRFGKYNYKYEILCGEGLVFMYFYRPVNGEYWVEQGAVIPEEDLKIIDRHIKEYGLPEFPKD